MEDGWLTSILNNYSSVVMEQMYTMICDYSNCDCDSVTGENIREYLQSHRGMFVPLCPFCGGKLRFVLYTDCRNGFLCDSCKAMGTNYCGSF